MKNLTLALYSRMTRWFFTPVLVMILAGGSFAAGNSDFTATNPSLFRDLKANTIHTFWQIQTLQLIGLMSLTPTAFSGETNRPYIGWVDHPRVDHTFELGAPMGNGLVQFGGSLTTYFAGKIWHKQGLATLGSDLFSSQMIAAVVSTGLKVATHRTRPNGGAYSFPSGHTTLAFSAAGVFANKYGLVPAIIAEGAATYVGLSRLQENKHYISDVVAGALLGNYIAYEVVHRRASLGRLSLTTVSNSQRDTVRLAV